MLIVFYLLLMLPVGRSTDDQNFVTTTVRVGESVTLTCSRNKSGQVSMLFWIRFFAGNLPEILGKTFSFDYNDKKEISRIKTKQEPGRFVLHIRKTEQSDTAFYYCLISQHRIKIVFNFPGPEPDITAVIQHFLPDPVHPGDSVTLQCSVLSDSEKNTCPEQQHSVFWFNIGSDESPPSLIYAQTNSGDECERSLEAPSLQSCVYSFFKENISSSDAGTYYCAVVACGMVVFGNGTKLDIEVVSTHDSQKDDTFLFLLCAALAVSLIVIVFLVHAIRKKSCDCCKGENSYSYLRFNQILRQSVATRMLTKQEEEMQQQRKTPSTVMSGLLSEINNLKAGFRHGC
uniref:Ig-like domain-containing protein n=1 Tax=Amphiprion ocellaris TaxID=80972 RepID=A0A3Q1DDV0_AMPOC